MTNLVKESLRRKFDVCTPHSVFVSNDEIILENIFSNNFELEDL